MSDTLRYLYAVTRARSASAADVADVPGVEDAPVRLLVADDLAAVVSDVDADVFEASTLEERLGDLTWLAATARAHHRVVGVVGQSVTVAPVALATVFHDDDRVRALLRAGHDDLAAALDRLEGRSEWGLKVWLRRDAAPAEDARPASGAEYLRRRRAVLNDRRQGVDAATRAAEEVHERAAALVVESRRHRLQETSLTGSDERQLLNGAHLADPAQVTALRELVDGAAADPRLRVELTGPWVPYSFVRLSEPQPADGGGAGPAS